MSSGSVSAVPPNSVNPSDITVCTLYESIIVSDVQKYGTRGEVEWQMHHEAKPSAIFA